MKKDNIISTNEFKDRLIEQNKGELITIDLESGKFTINTNDEKMRRKFLDVIMSFATKNDIDTLMLEKSPVNQAGAGKTKSS
jgi:hypothetical protein